MSIALYEGDGDGVAEDGGVGRVCMGGGRSMWSLLRGGRVTLWVDDMTAAVDMAKVVLVGPVTEVLV